MDSQENQIVENQLHRSVLLDHEMVVDGVVLRERKELNYVGKFKEEWEEKWKPSIGQSNGGFVNFFKNLLSLN